MIIDEGLRPCGGSQIEDERTRAREKALVLLTDMDRTEKELREKLRKRDFREEAVEDAIRYVKSYGYIDDERYAHRYVELFSSRRSRRRIECDLLSKGISQSVISEALQELDRDAQDSLIDRLARKKMRSLDPDDPASRRKLMMFLAGKGFGSEEVIRAAERVWEERDEA